jgi:type I restriction enzyme S subunit
MMPWPMVALGEILQPTSDPHQVHPDQSYPNFGIYSFGRGLFEKPSIDGAVTSARTLFRVKRGQFIYSRLFAFEGAYGFVAEQFDGYFISNEYPTFDCLSDRLEPRYLATFFRWSEAWHGAASLATGMGDRRRRIQPEQLLKYTIPLPPLPEQRRIVDRVEAIAGRIAEARQMGEDVQHDIKSLLMSVYRRISRNAQRKPMVEIAPILRRRVVVDTEKDYPQIATRSFGRGTFHQPTLHGSDVTWEKPYQVKAGDILISNIKAWEGAIAVVEPEDDGRYGC